VAGEDFFLCFSPERVDPGNPVWHTRNTPKVIGGLTRRARRWVELYGRVFDTLVPVSSAEAAELVKLYENTFRMINIALVNEMAQVCERLDVDVWEVVEAAATKPFGFMKFTPGPGLGGHCIPLDPHYLSWKMRTLAYKTRMIELSSEINAEMPLRGPQGGRRAQRRGQGGRGSRVLVLGVAYKKDIDDLRESPALEIIQLLQQKGADVVYHDPFCPRSRTTATPRWRTCPCTRSSSTRPSSAPPTRWCPRHGARGHGPHERSCSRHRDMSVSSSGRVWRDRERRRLL
jgi:UDP-N-acetyl-D-glucosamine dehydrogenase